MTAIALERDESSAQCPICGYKIGKSETHLARFCPSCGARLSVPLARGQELFEAARDKDCSQRQAFLEAECACDQPLRQRIEALLAAEFSADSLLDFPVTQLADTDSVSNETPASSLPADMQIGPYRLLQRIGEGGMGSVYMAEQLRPVRRVVALKVVKAGLDSEQVVARFEAERQSLALMDHPNIAKVLDAGETERREPYFVMELVKGVPITEYCDANRLPTDQRVELMIDVCSAVQHAHQKGIIHRDLKPSNILVAQYDDRPVPKVIDFGVAKATHQKLTEKTLYTQLGQIVGTLEYMSPEQAVLNQLDVDTRTDVYSLGVVLYELLVGETPLDSKELRSQGLDQILRTIREDEPPRPSLRLSSQGQAATKTAAYRQTDQTSLSRTLRGELDWVVMKSLDKDRRRRYDSASRLAEDLNNYLSGEAVEARPPTVLYRLNKAWARNRVLLGSAGAIIVALSIGLIGMLLENNAKTLALKTAVDATASKEIALQKNERQRMELGRSLADRDNALSFVRDYCVLLTMTGEHKNEATALTIADKTGASTAWKLMIEGSAALYRDETEKGVSLFRQALKQEPANLSCKSMLCLAHLTSGDLRQYLILKNEIATATPRNQDEQMYSAHALLSDAVAYPRIASVIESHNSPLASVIFADVVCFHANATHEMERVLEAIARIDSVIELTGNSSYFSQAALKLRHTALVHKLVIDRDQTEREARQNIKSILAQRPDYLMGQWHIATFLDRFGPQQESHEAWLRILENRNSGFLQAYPVVAMTLADGEFERAANLLEGNQQFLSRIWRAYCVFRRDNRKRSDEFDELYETLKNAGPHPTFSYLDLLGLVGPLPELIEESQFFIESGRFSTESEFVRATSRFYADPDDDGALQNLLALSQKEGGFTSRGYYIIAVVRLLQAQAEAGRKSGEYRKKAIQMIDKIIARNEFGVASFYWAKSMKAILTDAEL